VVENRRKVMRGLRIRGQGCRFWEISGRLIYVEGDMNEIPRSIILDVGMRYVLCAGTGYAVDEGSISQL